MRRRSVALVAAIALAAFGNARAFAQGSFFTSLSGTVVDAQGGVIPGASVKVKNNGTGSEVDVVTGTDGGFNVPSLPGGNYSVTVELSGFRTTASVSPACSATTRPASSSWCGACGGNPVRNSKKESGFGVRVGES